MLMTLIACVSMSVVFYSSMKCTRLQSLFEKGYSKTSLLLLLLRSHFYLSHPSMQNHLVQDSREGKKLSISPDWGTLEHTVANKSVLK